MLTVSNDQKGLKKIINGRKRSKMLMKRSEKVRNDHANVHANGQERWTLNGQERLGKFESERNNALEPEKKIPAVFSPNIGSFFVFFSGNFLIFQEISEIFQETSWKNSSRY